MTASPIGDADTVSYGRRQLHRPTIRPRLRHGQDASGTGLGRLAAIGSGMFGWGEGIARSARCLGRRIEGLAITTSAGTVGDKTYVDRDDFATDRAPEAALYRLYIGIADGMTIARVWSFSGGHFGVVSERRSF